MYGRILKGETMQFYQRIKDTRDDKDIGQKDIASLLNITQQQYSLYETGKRKLPAEMIPIICKRLNVSSDYLFGLPKNLEWPR